jgi:coenzyme F420 hydrogenase subunit beta
MRIYNFGSKIRVSYKEKLQFKQVYDAISEKLKAEKKKGVFGNLIKDIVKSGKCIRCGACSSVCDVLGWDNEKNEPKLTGKCTACGTCYSQCPQVNLKYKEDIGTYLSCHAGVSKMKNVCLNPDVDSIENVKCDSVQNGGVVTSLLSYLLKEAKFDGAIVVQQDPKKTWYPIAKFVKTSEDILKSSGTIYSHAQVIPPLIEAIINGAKKIAFVGTPCNIESVLSMLKDSVGFIKSYMEKVQSIEVFRIGLFCMDALIPENICSQINTDGIDVSQITKMEISGGKLKLYNGSKLIHSYPIKSLNEHVDTSCYFCKDFTSEGADISIGNVGTPDNVNSVIIRTEQAKKYLTDAIKLGYIQVSDLKQEGFEKIENVSQNKKNKKIPGKVEQPVIQKDKFIPHTISDWSNVNFGYTPIVNDEKYTKCNYSEVKLNQIAEKDISKSKLNEKPDVFLSKIPDVNGVDIIPYSYSSAYDLTIKLLKDYNRIKGGKIFVKPNNTGFVGIFKTDALKHVLKKNGITDNADDQQIATQPSIIKGIVDALLDLGAKTIHIGENMLWDGGAPRAFYETGYTKVLSDEKYKGKVFFIDFYQNDPPTDSLKRLNLEPTEYNKVDYYSRCFPPKALFEEKYDLIYVASIVKTHNCSYYSLSVKNFSVTWNPRKKTGNIMPRWHIHGLPVNIFLKKNVKLALGEDFKRKYKYLVREAFKYQYSDPLYKERIVKRNKSKIILTNEFTSSGLMNTITSFDNQAFDVDPHHWTGITLGIGNLGMGYLITRYNRIFSAVLQELQKYGTRVASFCNGMVAQEGDGPLVYGNKKYAGFAAASFDHVALEKVVLDMMFGTDQDGFKGFIVKYQKKLMTEFNIKDEGLIKDAESLWTLQMLKDFIGGEMDNAKMNLMLLDYTNSKAYDKLKPNEVYKLRRGLPFDYSKAFFVSPVTWLRALHTDDGLAMHAFVADKKTIEIPLIPGVVK